ncbi:MAG TPA: S8 family serine peptidase [Thermoanaerobaculia bacterium]|nr:S8 family serine peptidase [Thermoanaerobaculia bacterium]
MLWPYGWRLWIRSQHEKGNASHYQCAHLGTVAAQPVILDRHFHMRVVEGGSHTVEQVFPEVTYSSALSPALPVGKSVTDPLQPELRRRIKGAGSDERVEVLITFRDDISIPYFPKTVSNESETSAANQHNRRIREQLVRELSARREEARGARLAVFVKRFDLQLLEVFWLVDVWRASLPVRSFAALAAEPTVQYVQLAVSGTPPPAYSSILVARQRLNSNWFSNTTNIIFPMTAVRIALLDSGVRLTHELFNSPSYIRRWRDCVNGTSNNCATGSNLNPGDDYWNHGTASANVIAGNNVEGDDYRGVTKCTIDSYKVYNSGGLVEAAAIRAFSAAVAEGAWVIAAEIQSPTASSGAVAAAADAAYDAGVVVVAADGNSTTVSSVAAPANAHKVIGVGGVYADVGGTIPEQVSGPTSDSRIKPDVQAPSYVWTASNAGDLALGRPFNGTSAATAFAAGGAALLSKWRCDSPSPCFNTPPPDYTSFSGVVYVGLIAYASQSYPFSNSTGAGPLRLMGSYGYDYWGWVTIQNGQTIDTVADVYQGSLNYTPQDLQVALWWPEEETQTHSRIELRVLNPSGSEVTSSTHTTSVFQRANVPGSIAWGNWKVRIVGSSVSVGSQRVFYWFRVRGGA